MRVIYVYIHLYAYQFWKQYVSNLSIYLSMYLSILEYSGSSLSIYLSIYPSTYINYPFWECCGSDLSIYHSCPPYSVHNSIHTTWQIALYHSYSRLDATRPGCQTIWKGVASEVHTDLAAEIHSAAKLRYKILTILILGTSFGAQVILVDSREGSCWRILTKRTPICSLGILGWGT